MVQGAIVARDTALEWTMPISIQKARVLSTKPEFTLYRASLPKTLRKLSVAVIKRDVVRARNLRDKYRQLAKKQARGGKEGERTQQKAQLFDETLVRFQAGLKVAEKAVKDAQAARRKARAPGKKKVVRKKSAAKKKAAAKKQSAASRKAIRKKS